MWKGPPLKELSYLSRCSPGRTQRNGHKRIFRPSISHSITRIIIRRSNRTNFPHQCTISRVLSVNLILLTGILNPCMFMSNPHLSTTTTTPSRINWLDHFRCNMADTHIHPITLSRCSTDITTIRRMPRRTRATNPRLRYKYTTGRGSLARGLRSIHPSRW